MPSNINPQFPYYILLYVLTIIIRLIRAYKARPKDSESSNHKDYWSNYFYFGFELVNVSAGVFILLSQRSASFVATFMLMYVILVVISNFLEDEQVGTRIRTIGHILVSVIIFSLTSYAFLNANAIKAAAEQSKSEKAATWRIALPYMDTSLNRNYSVKNDILKSVFVCDVQGITKSEAIQTAKRIFYSQNGPNPFLPKTEKSPISMIILEIEIVAERISD